MQKAKLGNSELMVAPICLGTMTFGEQVGENESHQILARSLELGVDFMDTAEMYAVPPSEATYNATETFIGNYFAKNPGVRNQWTVATKVAGPSRGMPWIRGGSDILTAKEIMEACDGSLKRLQTDVIDLYQIHWPSRSVPMFGGIYYKPADNTHDLNLMHEQLGALTALVKAGKVRAIGLSNESAFGLHAFMQLAQQHNLSPIASVQNPYSLVNRSIENGLDETMHQLDVALLAYSPLAFGILTGKYDSTGLYGEHAPQDARMVKYDSVKKQRWARPDALASAKLYNNLASKYGLTPTQLALAFCYHKWQVTSTIIGVTSLAQLDECVQAYNITLSKECLTEIDALRWLHRDYAQ